MSERDLAEAIYDVIASDYTAAAVLDLWQHRQIGASDRADMQEVLATIAEYAIASVLARRQSLAARDPSRWDGSTLAGTNPGDTSAGTRGKP